MATVGEFGGSVIVGGGVGGQRAADVGASAGGQWG